VQCLDIDVARRDGAALAYDAAYRSRDELLVERDGDFGVAEQDVVRGWRAAVRQLRSPHSEPAMVRPGEAAVPPKLVVLVTAGGRGAMVSV
jgi:hypothetical protein